MGQGSHRPSTELPEIQHGGREFTAQLGGGGQRCGLPLQKEIKTQAMIVMLT